MKRGFTLVEVMVSIALFAVLGLVCLGNYMVNIKVLGKMKEDMNCFILAQRENVLYKSAPDDFDKEGNFDSPYSDYSYQTKTEDITLSDSTISDSDIVDSQITKNLNLVSITISGKNSSITVPIGIEKPKTQ